MDNKRMQELAGIPLNEDVEDDKIEAEEEKMMVELQPLKKQLAAIMKKYPHASYDDVTHWLKG